MRRTIAFFASALTLGVASALGVAQDFSADVVFVDGNVNAGPAKADTSSRNQNPSRIYVSNDKMRLEVGGPAGTVLLVNGTDQTAFAILPAKKQYERLAGGVSEYFRVNDAQDACPDWQKASVLKVDCEKLGEEIVDGRQTVKYRNRTASDMAISAVWIDPKLKFVVKWEGAGKGAEFRNIQEAKHAAELFQLPSNFDLSRPLKGTSKGFSNR